jgi:hypothetical protein
MCGPLKRLYEVLATLEEKKMNRLVITILLVLAFAVSFAKLAFAGDDSSTTSSSSTDGTTASHGKGKGKRSHTASTEKVAADSSTTTPAATSTTDTTTATTAAVAAAPATPATPATPVLPATLKLSDICGTDKDCAKQEFTQSKDGKEIDYTITNSFDNVTGQFTATVKKETCNCAIDQAMAKVTVTTDIKPTQTDDLRAFAKEAIANAVKNLDAYNAELDAKDKKKMLLDTCTFAKADYKMVDGEAKWTTEKFKKPKIVKSKASENPEDFSATDYTPSELEPVVACEEKSMKKLENSTDDKDIAAVNVLVKRFDKRYAELRGKAAQGTMTEADLEEFKNMNDFQTDVIAKNDTMSQVSAEYFYSAALKANTDFKAMLAQGNASVLGTMNKAASLQYASDVQLAEATMGNLDSSDKNYASKLAFLNGLGKDPASDFMNATKRATDALPAGSKIAAAAGDSSLTSYLNQLQGTTDATTGKTAAQVAWDKDVKDATGKYLVRGDGTNGSAGDMYAAIMVKEPVKAQCFVANNASIANSGCPKLNVPAVFALQQATVGGSGFVASQSATNYNTPQNFAARSSNTMTNFSTNRGTTTL